MSLEEIRSNIIELSRIRDERTFCRKKLFKFLRKNVEILEHNDFDYHWIKKKMDFNWLSDLNDKTLIEMSNKIYRRLTN